MDDNSHLWIRKGREQLTQAEKVAPNMTAAERVQAAQAYALLAIATRLRGAASSPESRPAWSSCTRTDPKMTSLTTTSPDRLSHRRATDVPASFAMAACWSGVAPQAPRSGGRIRHSTGSTFSHCENASCVMSST
ncbi:hypothetical protein FHX44_11822 [Pseudonocardia hierapolitana]|uniref:Uncharacterized protein n=1 Tax=Pseudonocardia hierapolitana TaxID=1128676 RepID=A0A561SJ75_9PSEU|nr:hypothetical protein [Pseudonocardia hierapolitana]TWF74938.1 hypothetical protein FHX44_11822 [Pseudonocardia hierapolitana]